MKYLVGAVVFIFVSIHEANTLQCWTCSSDIDPQCRDTFNQSEILSRGGGGSLYNNLQQNYERQQYDSNPNYYNQRQYDPNLNNQRQYDPNFNRGQGPLNQNFNPNFNNQLPKLAVCDENEARNRRMKNVCLKEVVKGNNNYVSIVRRCEMIHLEDSVGTCKQSVSKGLYLGFCEYCDYDGCNSATGLKTNIFLAAIAASALAVLYH